MLTFRVSVSLPVLAICLVGGATSAGGQVAPDVPEFLEIERGRALGGLDPERRVTPRPAAARNQIFLLHLVGQRKELLGQSLGAVDQLLADLLKRLHFAGSQGDANFVDFLGGHCQLGGH